MGKVKETLKKVGNKIKENKEKIIAWGSLLTLGATIGSNVQLRQEFETVQAEEVSQEQQIATLIQQVEQLKNLPNTNAPRLEKIEALLSKLEAEKGITEDEFDKSVALLKEEITKQFNSALESVTKEETSTETKEEVQEVLISQLMDDLKYGFRTDYNKMFLEAEALEKALVAQKESGAITEAEFTEKRQEILAFQGQVYAVIYATGVDKLDDKTGYTKAYVAYESSREIVGDGAGVVMIDSNNGRAIMDGTFSDAGNEEVNKSIMEGRNYTSYADGYYREANNARIDYDMKYVLTGMAPEGKATDFDYNVINGYVAETEDGSIGMKINPDNTIDSIILTDQRMVDESEQKDGSGKVVCVTRTTAKYSASTKEEFEKKYAELKAQIEKLKEEQQSTENE